MDNSSRIAHMIVMYRKSQRERNGYGSTFLSDSGSIKSFIHPIVGECK